MVNKLSLPFLVIVVTVASLALFGCTNTAQSPEPTSTIPAETTTPAVTPSVPDPSQEPEVTTIPAEPAGYPQPNPYWGLGFKPDGTPYKFGIAAAGLHLDWWLTAHKVVQGQLAMSGADVTLLDAQLALDSQISIVEDFIAQDMDGIVMLPLDYAGMAPSVDAAWAQGIPSFAFDTPVDTDSLAWYCGTSATDMGRLGGQMVVELAEKENEQIYVYNVYCPLSFDICVSRIDGFYEAIQDHPLITVTDGPEAVEFEVALNAVSDFMPSHPEYNTIYTNGSMHIGAIEALKNLGMYYPIGDPNHINLFGLDDTPAAVEALRGNYLDGCVGNTPWAVGDLTAKAVLTQVCLGETIPKTMYLPVDAITPDNVDTSPYGVDMRWGPMLEQEPDPTKWPILDMSSFGMPTPAYQP